MYASIFPFPGYVFVHLAPLRDRLRVLQTPASSGWWTAASLTAGGPGNRRTRRAFSRDMLIEPHPYLIVGHRVRVKTGPAGIAGILARKKNNFRFVVSLDIIMRSVSLSPEIDVAT